MAKQTSVAYEYSLKSETGSAARRVFRLGAARHVDAATVVMIAVSLVTAYLVLPPLYSVVQTSLFTTKLTGEIDQFTFRYYKIS